MPNKKTVNAAKSAVSAPKAAVKAIAPAERVFKTKWFNSEAKSEGISDQELCKAIDELKKGQGEDLGGGVWKKRLTKNMYRSIVLTKARKRWIFAFLFAKKDQANIDEKELKQFKKLAKGYGEATDAQLNALVKEKELVEICHDCKN